MSLRFWRRVALLATVATLLVSPCTIARPQTNSVATIGILHGATRADAGAEIVVLLTSLREAGFVEGRNLRVEYRFADYDFQKLYPMAEELVRAKVQLIYAPTTWSVAAAQAATHAIPIVFSGVNDPVGRGLIDALARPGGNTTGVSLASAELTAKRVQLMRELFPEAGRLGLVYDKEAAKECGIELREVEAAGEQLGVGVEMLPYVEKSGLADAFGKARRAGIPGLLVPTTYETRRFGEDLRNQALATGVPLIYASSAAVEAGGLISYGPAREWAWRRAAHYITRILDGARPSELPVERPTRYELVINLKTARAIGFKVPQSILLRADRVIE